LRTIAVCSLRLCWKKRADGLYLFRNNRPFRDERLEVPQVLLEHYLYKRSEAQCLLSFLFVLSVILTGFAGQDRQRPSLESSQVVISRSKTTLADALKSLADQTGRNIIADDLPRRGAQEIEVRGTVRAALDEIGRRFDYTWEETKAGDIVLYKRFEDPAEHPQISRAAAFETVRAFLQVLNSLGVRPAPSGMNSELQSLYQTLTPQQLQQIANDKPLFVRDLSLAQQQAVTRALIHQGFCMVPIYCEALASKLKGIEFSCIVAPLTVTPDDKAEPRLQREVLTYVWPDKLRSRQAPLPHFAGIFMGDPDTPTTVGDASRNTVPISDEVRQQLNSRVMLPLGQTTLGAVAVGLSAQTGVRVQAAGYLESHRLIVQVGASTGTAVLNLLCELTGWRYQAQAAGGILITRPRPKAPRQWQEVYPAVCSALPREWQRFLAQVPAAGVEPSRRDDMYRKIGAYEEKVLWPAKRRRIASLTRGYAERLRAAIHDQGDLGPHELSYLEMTEEQREGLTSCLFLDALDELCGMPAAAGIFLGKPALYQSNPGSAQIRIRNGTISLVVIEEKNGLHTEQGFGNARVGPRR
jgi:hypothetical protein